MFPSHLVIPSLVVPAVCLAAALAQTPAPVDGRAIFERACQSCHNGGDPRAPAHDAMAGRSPQAIVDALTSGSMRYQGLALSGPERRAVAEFITGRTLRGTVSGATVYKRAKTDSASTPLVTGLGLAYNLQVTPTKLVFAEVRTTGGALHIYRTPLAGSTLANLEDVATATSGTYLVKQGDYVYWTIKSAKPNGKLQRLKYADDTATAEDVVTGLDLPEGLTSDAQYLYFKQKDALYRAPVTGGAPEQLSPVVPAHDAQATQVFHADDKYVYFAAGAGFGDSTLVRVAK